MFCGFFNKKKRVESSFSVTLEVSNASNYTEAFNQHKMSRV